MTSLHARRPGLRSAPRSTWWHPLLAATLAASACQFPQPPDVLPTDAQLDAPIVDAMPTEARLEATQDLHDFGAVVLGGSSAVFQVTVRNSGELATGAITLTLAGAAPGEFEVVPTGDSNDCAGMTLTGGGSCRAQVRYRPTADQPSGASLIVGAEPGGSVAIPVTGDALTAARLTSLTATDSFGGVVVGTSSPVHRFIIQNDGEQPSGVLGVSKSGTHQAEFVIVPVPGSDCQGATLGQQGTCDVEVRFAPMAPAAQRMATVVVTGTPGGAHTIALSGDALTPGDLTIEQPTGGGTLDFGARDLGTGTTSTTQTVRVRNQGGVATGALVVAITGGGNASYVAALDGCNGNPLGAGAACDIQVRFNPAAIGAQPATVTIRDNASGATQAVNLTGVGTGTVTVTKTGGGVIASAPTGLMCGAGCATQAASFATTPVTLTATADPSWQFERWGGACASAGTASVCALPIALAMTSVSATFRQLFTLTVTTAGMGGVISSPFGVSCGAAGTDCAEPFAIGTNVVLTAEPAPGWEVASWTGAGVACSAGQRTCATSMTQARTVAVEFRPLYTLTVTTSGSGAGSVTGGGIACASPGTGVCTIPVIDGTSVTLNRVLGSAASGSQQVFGGWGGDCASAGTATACTFTMTAARSVAATFTLQHRLTLTINSVGGAQGTILANPGGVLCTSGTCQRFFDAGTTVTISATPATGLDVLQSVAGDCSATPCTLANLDGPRTVTASFLPAPGDLEVALPASGSLDFGARDVASGAASATQTVRIRNSGGSATGALAVSISGGGASSFTAPSDTCGGVALGAGLTCDVAVRFNPTAVGALAAVITVRDSVSGAARGVNVGGTGTGTVVVTRTGSGTVTSTPAGLACGATCTASFATTPLVLSAAPDPGWVFDAWSGACAAAGTATTCALPLGSATTNVGATFRPLYTLTVMRTGSGGVTSAPVGITCGADCVESYVVGTSVVLTAEPDPGWEVASWTGAACAPAQRACTVAMTQARAVAIEFRPLYTVAVTVGGSGAGTVTGGGLSCASGSVGTCAIQVISGASITLTQAAASAASGSQNLFNGWGGDCASAGTGASCTLTVSAARSIAATFTRQHRLTLAINSIGGAMGALTANPGAFTCGAGSCQRFFDQGTLLTVTATPATGLDVLQGVTGDCTASPCTLGVDAPKAVTAAFLPAPGSLEVAVPLGGGTLDFGAREVGSGPSSPTQTIRIRNSGGSATGALGVTVTGGGSASFTTVLDGCAGLMLAAGATCDVTVRFNPTTVGSLAATTTVRDTVSGAAQGVTVTGVGTGRVTVSRTGNGSVTSAPAGLSCGTTCTASFSAPPVTLTATADPGWVFDSWGGACASAGSAPTCALALTSASTAVTATFRQLFTLTVTVSGSGTVTSAPTGITCGADCSEAYVVGTSVTLTAEPGPGYEVFAWTGTGATCTAYQRTCTVAMSQARAATVEFRLLRPLGVSVTGNGTGSVAGSGISCASGGAGTCAVSVFDGASVTLTATIGAPATGQRNVFAGWGGDCAGTATTCTFTMTAARSVTSTFTREYQLTQVVQSIGGAAGSLTADPGGFVCTSGSCPQYYPAGTTLTVTAAPATSADVLQSVSGDCAASPCSLTMDAARTVTATFQPTAGDLAVVTPASGTLDFGTVTFGTASPTQAITIRNSGGSTTGVLAVTGTGAGAASFTTVTDGCIGTTLAAGASCTITARLTPAAVGALAAIVTVRDTGSGTARGVNVIGAGSGSVTVTKTGSGTVTSTPAGLSCGTSCGAQTAAFATTPVSLSATADPGWVFETWTGACAAAGAATTCALPLTAASTSVGATFRQLFTLTVATTGAGTVSSAPAGISCGADCSEAYVVGTSVTLTAEPGSGYEVFSWTGTGTVCAAGQRTCTFPMTLARNVTVEFRQQFTLAVTVSGTGTGTVTGSGINCGSGATGTCSVVLFQGASATLSQAPGTAGTGSQHVFGGWAGACTGTGGCTFTMTANKTVTSTFTLQHRLTLNATRSGTGMGTITVNPGGLTCTTSATLTTVTCTPFVDAGVTYTVTAVGATMLDGVQSVVGDCSATPCTLASLSAPRTVTTTFTHFACVPSSATCSLGQFSQCDATGSFVSHVVPNGSATGTSTTITMNNYSCPLGCHASGTRCNDVDAANGLNAAMDTVAVSPAGIDLILPRSASAPAGKVVLNTSTYDATNGEASITDPDGVVIRVPATIITQTNAPDILVLKVRSFTVRPGRVLEVYGARALAVASHFDVYIGGTLDGSGESLNFAGHAGPGGRNGLSMCSGSFGTGGASGGGGWSSGGMGSGGTLGGSRGASFVPLSGGCDGGYNDGTVGAGGGGIQLASRTRVAIGAAGVVNVSGAGGGVLDFLGYLTTGGGGGGAVLVQTRALTDERCCCRGSRWKRCCRERSKFGWCDRDRGTDHWIYRRPSVMCTGCLTSGSGGYEGFGSGGSSATGAAPAYGGGGGGCGAFRLMNASGIFTPPAGALKLLVPSGVSALDVR
ncbi:MAG: choice-of-anchor D domain-containing protein [Myxococcales bacterium]|nr:choice-of-anchor D domain-containing protein [Myxococcales bacterium]